MGFLQGILNQTGLPPHGFCLLWEPTLILLNVASDAVIAASYYAIPLALAFLVLRRPDVAFGWIFWLFASFILACGTTHLMEIWVIWHPAYGVEGLVKAVTAAVSLFTTIMLWPLVLRLINYPSPTQFSLVSSQLATASRERRNALTRLQETEQVFRLLVKGVSDYAIFMLDPAGRVTTWNAGAERMKGYREEDIVGQHFSRFYTPEERNAGAPVRALETAAREGRFETEGWRVRKDGSRFWANVVLDSLRDEQGRLIGYAKVTRDITERRQAEQALEQARSALAQSQKMQSIGQLAGGIAHDFNNLLTAVLGGASLLERRAGERLGLDGQRLLISIMEAARRAAALTRQMLAFSRKQTLIPKVTDANTLIAEMSELLRRTLGERILIETVSSGDLWPTLVDTNQLENAILNLALNARDAMPEGGKLTLETGNVHLDQHYAATDPELIAGEYVMIAVTDNGTGMTPEVASHAFEPFFTTKPEGFGTGLGLSQVFGFVKQSGGHTKIYSEPGRGTTVRIYLPRYMGEEQAGGGVATTRPEGIPGGHETVLVVEDHEVVREFVSGALRHLGYRVLDAAAGNRALELLATTPGVALLLTDVVLPGLNGRQLAEEACRRVPGLAVVYMTGYTRNAMGHQGVLEAGAHLLPKPFTVETMARKVREVLDQQPKAAA